MTTASTYTWITTEQLPVYFVSDDLTLLIYNQLLELYAWDLEVELMSEKLKTVMPVPAPTPYPWDRNKTWPQIDPWNTPYYGPPYKVTSSVADDRLVYSEKYDAFYNSDENVWTESRCSDPTCEFCTDRPERPL